MGFREIRAARQVLQSLACENVGCQGSPKAEITLIFKGKENIQILAKSGNYSKIGLQTPVDFESGIFFSVCYLQYQAVYFDLSTLLLANTHVA